MPIRFVRRSVLSADTFCRRYVMLPIRFVADTFCPPIRFVSVTFCSQYVLYAIRFGPLRFVPIRFVTDTFCPDTFCPCTVRRHQMSCCMFPSFPAGSIVTLWNPKNPPQFWHSNFVASYQQHSSVQVEFHNNKDSFLRAAEILQAPTMCSRDILQQAKGDHLDRVHSVQMVLKMIRQGRLVQRTRSSAEAKSLKTRVKGTVRLPRQLDSSRGSQTGGQGWGPR
jgi:hypothetical protein